MSDLISRQAAIDAIQNEVEPFVIVEPGTACVIGAGVKDADVIRTIEQLPPAQPEYEPVTAEDFAKTMSETSVYSYMLWHSEALTLMERQGFVICKKTM